MYIDCQSIHLASSAFKQTCETLRKINSSCTLVLSLLTSFTVVIIAYKSVAALVWRKINFGQSIWNVGNRRNHCVYAGLWFSKALNTSSWKDSWSKGSHFENSASFKISWTWSDVFRINENFIQQLSAMFKRWSLSHGEEPNHCTLALARCCGKLWSPCETAVVPKLFSTRPLSGFPCFKALVFRAVWVEYPSSLLARFRVRKRNHLSVRLLFRLSEVRCHPDGFSWLVKNRLTLV